MLFAARILAGILSSATIPTAMAYIGDSTSDEERGGGMGIIGAAMGVGMVLGPGLGGWLAADALSTPFFLAAALSVLALVLIFLLLPESLPAEQRGTAPAGQESRWRELAQALVGPIGFLLLLAFLLSFGLTNFESVFGLYSLHRFDYGPQRVGGLLAVIGIVSAVVQGMLTGPLSRRWGEALIVRLSLLGSAIGFLLMLAAYDLVTVLLTISFFIISNAMLRPAISSLISKRATVGQGVAMGLNNSFMSLGRIAGPIWAGFLFDVDIRLPYVSGALVMLAGFALCLFWLSPERADAAPTAAPL
jgi:DHA1 family multidrug resistance protein-like MFS transporter